MDEQLLQETAVPPKISRSRFLILDEKGKQHIIPEAENIDPHSIESDRFHHKQEHALLKKKFKEISATEGIPIVFYFGMSSDGKTESFSIRKEVAERLGIELFKFSRQIRQVYPLVMKQLNRYLSTTTS